MSIIDDDFEPDRDPNVMFSVSTESEAELRSFLTYAENVLGWVWADGTRPASIDDEFNNLFRSFPIYIHVLSREYYVEGKPTFYWETRDHAYYTVGYTEFLNATFDIKYR